MEQKRSISRRTVLLMAITCGFTVSNVYLNQNLLLSMAETFRISSTEIGIVATLSQVGYAIGNLTLVPLGDLFERRKMILSLLMFVCLSLVASALSPNFIWLIMANLFLGFFTIVPQIIVPLAASFSIDKERGKVLGNVAIGLVCGILGARFISGVVNNYLGWRSMYWISFGCTLVIILLIKMHLPKSKGIQSMKYGELLQSLWPLFLREKILRRACVSQAMMFGAFSLFWTTLVFRLSHSPFHYSSSVAGTIGLVGIGGAFATPIIGRIIDHKGATFANILCMLLGFISFMLFTIGNTSLIAIVIGSLFITMGTQANQVACQAQIFLLPEEIRSRLNGIYMVSTFLGGALGSYLGTLAWSHYKWGGVCFVGLIMIIVAFTSAFGLKKKINTEAKVSQRRGQ
ncbi:MULTISPECIES: MFS transporter [Terrilactibacillus]|uniref:MFS transporter n=2 Tax=Terrilactibacillus TaxID=1795633 RepID=A0A6N8CSP8_9BACI|nr:MULTISPECIES: MFS transporter [Terrilactibacillus]MTT32083.1 MFS transporter [Terrilactibacillus tamarindi]